MDTQEKRDEQERKKVDLQAAGETELDVWYFGVAGHVGQSTGEDGKMRAQDNEINNKTALER